MLSVGVGYGMIVLTGIVSTYYNVILAWTLYYFGMSFFAELPWTRCDAEWNTDNCVHLGQNSTHAQLENNYTDITNETSVLRGSLHSVSAAEFWK